jgi:hypothetical protein
VFSPLHASDFRISAEVIQAVLTRVGKYMEKVGAGGTALGVVIPIEQGCFE